MRVLLLLAALAASSTVSRAQPLPATDYPDGYAGVRTALAAQGYAAPSQETDGRFKHPACPEPRYCRRVVYAGMGLVAGTVGAVVFWRMYHDIATADPEAQGEAALSAPFFQALAGTLAVGSTALAVGAGAVLVITLREGPEPHRRR
jgi:hypothetical protein